VINNAGILRDKSFASMVEKEWHDVMNTHLRGTYSICKAAWPIFIEQKYGRIVNTTSAVGIYGNFGQTNVSRARACGLCRVLTLVARAVLDCQGRHHRLHADARHRGPEVQHSRQHDCAQRR
jgi:NAD(P)-dependent dehydrogenase (short-subunit alcohol dehydrogenase family)